MQIYLYQNEQQTGPYTEQQIRDLVAAGTIRTTDVCWYEGLSDWQPLDTVISFQPSAAQAAHHGAVTSQQAAPTVIQTNVKQGALIGGVACFAIGILLMFLSMWSFIIYGPLFLVAFILSIVAMAQRRVLGGILLLLATLVVPSILGLYLFTTRATEALTASVASSEPTVSQSAPQTEPTALPEGSPLASEGSVSEMPVPSTSSTPKSEPPPVERRPAKNPKLDAKMGFRNYKLGTPIGDFNPDDLEAGQAFVKTYMKPYFARNFDPKLGAAEIDAIQLNFNEDLLESVTVRVEGEQNALALRETLIAGYGQPDKTTNFMTETIRWEGDDCILSLDNELMGGANARFSSKSVDKKIKEIKLRKAKDEAASGAEAL
jgi:hypothetical protein